MGERTEVVSTRLPAHQKRRLRAIAAADGVSLAHAAERLLSEGIRRRLAELVADNDGAAGRDRRRRQ
jgi:hypothetical protein